MKIIKSACKIAILSLFTVSTGALAQVASINFFQPLAGKAPLTLEYMQEARAIHEAMGVSVGITSDLRGQYGYAMYFENWAHMGRVFQSLGSNPSWQAFQSKISISPSANQVDNLQLALSDPGAGVQAGNVSEITVWEVTTGTMGELMEGGMGAKPIHERAGANVAIFSMPGRMYYVTSFDSFEAWGAFRDTPNPEFQRYMQGLQRDSNGQLGAVVVERHTIVHH